MAGKFIADCNMMASEDYPNHLDENDRALPRSAPKTYDQVSIYWISLNTMGSIR